MLIVISSEVSNKITKNVIKEMRTKMVYPFKTKESSNRGREKKRQKKYRKPLHKTNSKMVDINQTLFTIFYLLYLQYLYYLHNIYIKCK